MSIISSECCDYPGELYASRVGYCYVCGTFHRHRHLDLRALKTELFAQTVGRHDLCWREVGKDEEKVAAMSRGEFCASLLHELRAFCGHGKPLAFRGQPLRLHTCYKGGSVTTGLDFTTAVCMKRKAASIPEQVADNLRPLLESADHACHNMDTNAMLRYDPDALEFVSLGIPATIGSIRQRSASFS